MGRLLWLLTAALVLSCGNHAVREPGAEPPPTSGPSEWDKRISAGTVNHTDRIGIGRIEQLALGGPSSAVKIAEFLRDPGLSVRRKAAEVLTGLGSRAEPALPEVVPILRSSDQGLRLTAAQALAGIGSPRAAEALDGVLDDPSPAVRAWAHVGLVRAGAARGRQQRGAAELLRESGGQAALEIALALALLDCADDAAIESLGRAVQASDPDQRAAAATALGRIGPKAAVAVPKLIGLLGSGEPLEAKMRAVTALGQMGAKSAAAVPLLVVQLGERAPGLRALAARALGEIGPPAREALQALDKAVQDVDPSVQAAARRSLLQIRGPTPPTPPTPPTLPTTQTPPTPPEGAAD